MRQLTARNWWGIGKFNLVLCNFCDWILKLYGDCSIRVHWSIIYHEINKINGIIYITTVDIMVVILFLRNTKVLYVKLNSASTINLSWMNLATS